MTPCRQTLLAWTTHGTATISPEYSPPPQRPDLGQRRVVRTPTVAPRPPPRPGSGGAGAAAAGPAGSALGDDSDDIAGGSKVLPPLRRPATGSGAADGGEVADGSIGGCDPEGSPNTLAAVAGAPGPGRGWSFFTDAPGFRHSIL